MGMEQIIAMFWEVSPAKALVVFLVTAFSDTLWAIYIRRVTHGKTLSASTLSAIIIIAGGLVAIEYIGNNWYLLPAAIGAFVGTFLTIKFDNRKAKEVPEIHKIVQA